jgi:ankyrin repeat protein
MKKIFFVVTLIIPFTLSAGLFSSDNEDIIRAVNNNNVEKVSILLNKGVEPNVNDKDGYSLLVIAISNDNLEIVKKLVDKGANIDEISINGNTPLMIASYQRKTEIVKYLLEKGANKNVKNDYGMTALGVASTLETIKLLQKDFKTISAIEIINDFRNNEIIGKEKYSINDFIDIVGKITDIKEDDNYYYIQMKHSNTIINITTVSKKVVMNLKKDEQFTIRCRYKEATRNDFDILTITFRNGMTPFSDTVKP